MSPASNALAADLPLQPLPKAVADLLEAMGKTPTLWRSVDLRVIAVRDGERWKALLGHARVDSRNPDEVTRLPDLPDVAELFCGQVVMDAGKLEDSLRSLCSGRGQAFGSKVVHFLAQSESGSEDIPFRQGHFNEPASWLPVASELFTSTQQIGYSLTLNPGSLARTPLDTTSGLRARIDSGLRCLDMPWDGIYGLARLALGLAVEEHNAIRSQLQITASFGAWMPGRDATLTRGRLAARVLSESSFAEEALAIGYIGETSLGRYVSGTHRIPADRWAGESGRQADVVLDLPADVRRVTLIMRLGPAIVQTITVDDRIGGTGNPRTAVREVFHPGLVEALNARLDLVRGRGKHRGGSRDPAGELAAMVAQVFAVAGYVVDPVGAIPGVDDAVDHVCYSPDGSHVLVVECTLRDLQSGRGKGSRLIDRTNAIRRLSALQGMRVLPVMISALPSQDIPEGDREFVSNDGVAVLGGDGLLELAGIAAAGGSIGQVIALIESHIRSSMRTERLLDFVRQMR